MDLNYLLRPQEDTTFEYPEDGGTDWIDEALAKGMGFKSEEDKQAYLASLGDPLEHPLFAQSAEDCKDHPLAGAFRALNEEGKSNKELAEMYKDEGNEWLKGTKTMAHSEQLKKGVKGIKEQERMRCIREAANCYTHALNYVNIAIDEAQQQPLQGEAHEDLTVFKSIIYGNRAQSSLLLKNYGDCIRDSEKALELNNKNVKARYRKAKSLYQLKKFHLCKDECDIILSIPGEEKSQDCLTLKDNCDKEISKIEKLQADAKRLAERLERAWSDAWDIATKSLVKLGYAATSSLEALPQFDSFNSLPRSSVANLSSSEPLLPGSNTHWPVLYLYPQYNQIDINHGVDGDDMLVEHIASMFPEADDGAEPVSWDIYDEYHVSNLVVYYAYHAVPMVQSKEEWIACCKEQCDIRGARGDDVAMKAKNKCISRIANHQKRKDGLLHGNYDCVEVHMGCSFHDILRAEGNVISGGICTLIVFVRNNGAHEKFLKENKVRPNFMLMPAS